MPSEACPYLLMDHSILHYVGRHGRQLKACHNRGYGMRCVILCILTATSCVVILDEILKDIGEEVVMFRKASSNEKFANLSTIARAKGARCATSVTYCVNGSKSGILVF